MSKSDVMAVCYDFAMLQFCGDIGSDEWVNVMVIIREQNTVNIESEFDTCRAMTLWPDMDRSALANMLFAIFKRVGDVVEQNAWNRRVPTRTFLNEVLSMPQNNWRWTDIRPGVTRNLKETLIDLEQHYLRGER